MPTKSKSAEIRIIRVYDAPVYLAWEAWTDVEQVGQWWGPRGYTTTTHSKDVRTGGTWNYTMHGPEGKDWPTVTKYLEVEENKKLVYDHGGNDTTPPLFRVTVLFSESNGKTKMDMTMTCPTPEAAEASRAIIKKAGGNSTWDRLAEFLEKETHGKDMFVINRTFDAPREVVWDAWTDPEQFSQWLPPTGMTMKFIRCEVKEDGGTFYEMGNGKDVKMFGRSQYIEIRRPDRIVYTQQFCDEHENISRHPMAPTWPETMLTTVELSEEGPDKTRVTINWEVYGKCTPEELETFLQSRNGMAIGWTGSFDKLEEYLVK